MKRKIVFLALALALLTFAACKETVRINTLHPLSEQKISETGSSPITFTDKDVTHLTYRENPQCLMVNLPNEFGNVSMDTVFSSYTFIPLETREECRLGQIQKIIKCRDCYCILDQQNSKVFLFEEDGRFRCQLGEKGHAGNEHLDAWDVAYDKDRERLTLLDLTGRKLMHYDLQGNLLERQPLYFLYTGLEYEGRNMLCLTDKAHNQFSDILDLSQLVVIDSTHVPLHLAFRTTEHIRNRFNFSTQLKKGGDDVFFRDLVSDTLWAVSSSEIMPVFTFRVDGNQHFSADERENMSDRIYRKRSNALPAIVEWYITSDYLALSVSGGPKLGNMCGYLLCSRKTGHCKVLGLPVDPTRLGDDILGVDAVYDDSTFVTVVEPQILAYRKGDSCPPAMKQDLQQLLQSVQTDGNPILLLKRVIPF